MEFNAFQMIESALSEELAKQGFSAAQPLEDEEGKAVMFQAEAVAYSLLYDEKKGQFDLRSTTLDEDNAPGSWRSLSRWLFDQGEGTRQDAESIVNDFLEVVRGPKRMAAVQQKKKRGKDDDRSVDPLFFLNRVVNIFPELKEEMNEEKIVYGQVRFVTFVKEKVAPRCEELVKKHPNSDAVKKLASLLDDMYKNGDLDLRAILTSSLLNSMSDEGFAILQEQFGEELRKFTGFTRKLRGRNIKPEKKKKEKKVEARLGA